MSQVLGESPGKTAPKLFNDFRFFDPTKCRPTSNYLAGHTPPVGDGPQLAPEIGSCKHDYSTKHSQSFTPPLDLRPDGGQEYKVAVCCKKCRIHADVQIGFAYAINPCPNSSFPLHHFQRVASEDYTSSDRIAYFWQCSAPECGAQLKITFRLPRITHAEVQLLTSVEALQSRYEAMVERDPTREGLKVATPMDACQRLRKYIKDSLNPEHPRRKFPANNKRFGEAFGVGGSDCLELLHKLGFTYVENDGEEPQVCLPNPAKLVSRLRADGSSGRELLEDFEVELQALMYKIASETQLPNPSIAEGWASADKDVERTLAAQGWQRFASLRRTVVANEVLPYFASLGVLPESADSLVIFAYERQTLCDPARRNYYFECLQVISESRNTEELQMKVATLSSEDMVSRRDLTAAYRYFSITPAEAKTSDDERILNIYQARISDLGPDAQHDARQNLWRIGAHRHSQRLLNASKQTLETYEDALSWIGNGADKTTADDMLLTLATIKTSDNPDNLEMSRKAISVIARERKSNTLNSWLLTGRADTNTMSVEEALRHIGVEQSWDEIEKDMLPIMFDSVRQDRPGEQTEKAIETLQQAMAGLIPTSTHSPDTWPVGLTSHGNTCYLNSLLQYYFAIRPLREIVLNYDHYKLDTTKHAQKEERVGQRMIKTVEIQGGQRFAQDLKHLFERMIKDPGEHVKPEEDLVCRAFLEPEDYRLLDPKASLAETETAPQAEINGVMEVDSTTEKKANGDDTTSDASSVTLIGSVDGQSPDAKLKNVEVMLTPPASPKEPANSDAPPALPPRPQSRRFSTSREIAVEKAQEKARGQQDVTEAHDLITFRLRAGMTPKGKDESGEQEDEFRDLFKIGLVDTPVKDGVDGKKMALQDSSITVPVPNETTDVYSILDAVFDLQALGETSDGSVLETYKTLRTLPPLFQINIPRINFEAGNSWKSEACVRLYDELYLDRYCDEHNTEILPRRKACWGWRKQLHGMRKERKTLSTTQSDLDGPATVAETAKYLYRLEEVDKELEEIGVEGIGVNPALSALLHEDSSQQRERLATLDCDITALEAKLQGNFDNMRDIKYRLAAVFFHRGTHGHGHYWLYIHDFENDIWRSYNDEKVEEFTKLDEIHAANAWNHGTPTYAVYVRDDYKTQIIEPVCRAPEKIDEVMENSSSAPPIEVDERAPPMHQQQQAADALELVQEGGQSSWDTPRQVSKFDW